MFLCELNGMELTYLKRDLAELLNLNEDRALIVDTGPAENDTAKRTVPVNHSKQSIHMIGALEDGTLKLQFHDNLTAASYAELVKHLHRRYGKVGIMADNAGALTGRDMRKCLGDTGGDVEILHLPPHTP